MERPLGARDVGSGSSIASPTRHLDPVGKTDDESRPSARVWRPSMAARGLTDLFEACSHARDLAAMAQTAPVAGVSRRHEADVAAPTLLVDHWYSHAVGHVIEALRRCQAYHACDPALRVALVLNGASPLELARCATFVDEVFGVPYTSFGRVEGISRRALRCDPTRLGLRRPPPGVRRRLARAPVRQASPLLRGGEETLPGADRDRDRRAPRRRRTSPGSACASSCPRRHGAWREGAETAARRSR